VDTTPPSPVSDLNVATHLNGHRLTLSWDIPSDSDLAGILIRFSLVKYPEDPYDGQFCTDIQIDFSSTDSYTHAGLMDNITYYYTVFAYDASGNFSSGETVAGIPKDNTPPLNINSYNVAVTHPPGGFTFYWNEFEEEDKDWEWLRVEVTDDTTFATCYGRANGSDITPEPDCDSPNNWSKELINTEGETSWTWTRGGDDNEGLLYRFTFFIGDEAGNEGIPFEYQGHSGLSNPTIKSIIPDIDSAYVRFETTESNYDTGVRIVISDTGSNPEMDDQGTIISGDLVADIPNLDNTNNSRSQYYNITGLTGGTTYKIGLYSYLEDPTDGDVYSSGVFETITPLSSVDKVWEEDFEAQTPDACPTNCSCTDSNAGEGIDTWATEDDGGTSFCYEGTRCLFAGGNNDDGWVQPGVWYTDCRSDAHFTWKPDTGGTDPDLTNYEHAVLIFYAKEDSNYGSHYFRIYVDGDYNTGDQKIGINDDGTHDRSDWSVYFVDLSTYCGKSLEINFYHHTNTANCGREASTIDNIRLIAWND